MGANCCTTRDETTDTVVCENRSAPMTAPERKPWRIDDYTSSPRHRPLNKSAMHRSGGPSPCPSPTSDDVLVSPSSRRSTTPGTPQVCDPEAADAPEDAERGSDGSFPSSFKSKTAAAAVLRASPPPQNGSEEAAQGCCHGTASEVLAREIIGGDCSVSQRSYKSEKVQFSEEVLTHRYSDAGGDPRPSDFSLGELLLRPSRSSRGRSYSCDSCHRSEAGITRAVPTKMRGTALGDFYELLGEESVHIDELAGRNVSEYWHTGRATNMSIRPTNIIRRINGYSLTSERSTSIRKTRIATDQHLEDGEEELPDWCKIASDVPTSRQCVRGSEDMSSIRMSDFSMGTRDTTYVPLGTPRDCGAEADRPLGTPRIEEEPEERHTQKDGPKSTWSEKLRRWSADSSQRGGRSSHRAASDVSVVEDLQDFSARSNRTDESGKSATPTARRKKVEDLYDNLLSMDY